MLPIAEPLVTGTDLEGFLPDGPVPDAVVKAAAGSVRVDAGWHIAPVITETVEVNVCGDRRIVLPTRRVVEVLSVVDVYGAVLPVGEYMLVGQSLERRYGTWGHGRVFVELRHGFDDCPPELVPLVAARCQIMLKDPTLKQWSQTDGPYSRSETASDVFAGSSPGAVPPRYAVTPGF